MQYEIISQVWQTPQTPETLRSQFNLIDQIKFDQTLKNLIENELIENRDGVLVCPMPF